MQGDELDFLPLGKRILGGAATATVGMMASPACRSRATASRGRRKLRANAAPFLSLWHLPIRRGKRFVRCPSDVR